MDWILLYFQMAHNMIKHMNQPDSPTRTRRHGEQSGANITHLPIAIDQKNKEKITFYGQQVADLCNKMTGNRKKIERSLRQLQGNHQSYLGGALGAATGIVAYKAGKAIIKSAKEPFNHNGRNYNWDSHGEVGRGEILCSMPLSQFTDEKSIGTLSTVAPPDASTTATTPTSDRTLETQITTATTALHDNSTTPDSQNTTTTTPTAALSDDPTRIARSATAPTLEQMFRNFQYADGSRPMKIVWTCKTSIEVCCGFDCCPVPVQHQSPANSAGECKKVDDLGGIFVVLLIKILLWFFFLLLCCCGCCFGVFFCCREIFRRASGDNRQNIEYYTQQQSYQMQNFPLQQQQGHQYQPLAQNVFPQQPPPNYPQQPSY